MILYFVCKRLRTLMSIEYCQQTISKRNTLCKGCPQINTYGFNVYTQDNIDEGLHRPELDAIIDFVERQEEVEIKRPQTYVPGSSNSTKTFYQD